MRWRTCDRKTGRSHRGSDLAQQPEVLAPSPEERAVLLETRLEIDRCLDGLPALVKRTFLLAQLDGLRHLEIAAELGISLATVKRHLVRAGTQCFFAMGCRMTCTSASVSPIGGLDAGIAQQAVEWWVRLGSGDATETLRTADVFGAGGAPSKELPVDLKSLHATIEQLTLENDFFSGALDKAGVPSAKKCSAVRMRCRLRSRPVSSEWPDQRVLPATAGERSGSVADATDRRIDELHMAFPFASARMLARQLRRDGHEVARRRVRTLMKRIGVEALYCKPNTSRRNTSRRNTSRRNTSRSTQHKIWRFPLRGMKIDRANRVFALDTTNDGTLGSDSADGYSIACLDGKVRLAGMRHDPRFGGDLECRRIDCRDLIRQAAKCTFRYLSPVYGCGVIPATVSASDSDQTDTLHEASRFVQDAVHVTDRWIVVGGLRLLTYRQLAGKGRPFQLNTNHSDSKWLPRAGVIYKATDCLSQYGSYSESPKPTPTIAPLSCGVVIDSNVAPEHAKLYEVGAKFDMRFTLPAYFVADVFATYDTKIGRHPLHYQLNVKNVFNKTHYPSSASQYFVAVGDARSATLSATFAF